MPVYQVRLLDGQTVHIEHKSKTLTRFMRYLQRNTFVVDNDVAVALFGIATVTSNFEARRRRRKS